MAPRSSRSTTRDTVSDTAANPPRRNIVLMRVRTTNISGAKAESAEVRGPTGQRFQAWRQARGERYCERFGLDVGGDPSEVARARRRLRNARKVERRASCRR
jgi:hypothetical protein